MTERDETTDKKTQFEVETEVNLTPEQLSYICEYCGKVNVITAPNCVRCGKRRPRAEYVKAMNRLKRAGTVREEYLSRKADEGRGKNDVGDEQLARLVEERIADEKEIMRAQEELRAEREKEEIKKATARDAVLRIVAAENAADERIAAAEQRADETVKGRNEEIEALLAAEREKMLTMASEKLVAERAGIEEVAKEKIDAMRRASDGYIKSQLSAVRDNAEKAAARQAVLQIIAAENAAQDSLRISRNAMRQAAIERLAEERILAEKTASARYTAEKQAIERAADDRIRAERKTIGRATGGELGYGSYGGQIQPFAVVPYLNPLQPVNQYGNGNRVIYKFVPDDDRAETEADAGAPLPVMPKEKRSRRNRRGM